MIGTVADTGAVTCLHASANVAREIARIVVPARDATRTQAPAETAGTR
ncbi:MULTISPECIES: hypothetical protein [unclassified Streptomyces]|nr:MULTISPECIES: hypothetical protein [unclassified Streptomyces]MDF3147710.1 hypothetical protein [Streptomyces sp. T21Q-yed]WDF43936.1 hypothetical protein PBV52_47730 [Streptomyces sp. T12]